MISTTCTVSGVHLATWTEFAQRHLAGARVVAVVDPEGEEIELDDARSLPEMA